MTTKVLSIKIDDRQLRETLAKLPAQLNERARKTGARKALRPYVVSLGNIWRSARYRGKATHRTAIQSATQLDVRRLGSGPLAPIRTQIGVRYGSKGGARAKGRQRVYHLLELGFRHHGKGSNFYSNVPPHLLNQRDARRTFVKVQRDQIWKDNPGNSRQARAARSAAMFAMYGEARERFKELTEFTANKKTAMNAARGSAKMIPGAMRSYRWARRVLPSAMAALTAQTLAEARKLLGGRP